MTLPLLCSLFIARSRPKVPCLALVRRGGSSLAIAVVLSSCGNLPWRSEAPLRPVARRRAVSTSQRQEARMARPSDVGSQPVVDYGVYKRIHSGMALAEVQSLLGEEGERYEGVTESKAIAMGEAARSEAEGFWRWTHPSGAYNIHLRLGAGSPPERWVVESKLLSYNPPE